MPLSVSVVPLATPNRPNDGPQSLPVVNYASAVAKAVEWLGDRYLLATPSNATHRLAQLRRFTFSATASTIAHSAI